ncbi:MAG: hypothetical protein M3O15_02430 [Acidobacteriota bacterium]|nr:hypothetical protein [Acidobacteriota bacterium]
MGEAADRGRAAARAAAPERWPIRVYRLGEEPSEDLSATTTPAERLAMMWPLALDAWATAGRPLPDYPRHQAPVRILHAGIRRPPASGCSD